MKDILFGSHCTSRGASLTRGAPLTWCELSSQPGRQECLPHEDVRGNLALVIWLTSLALFLMNTAIAAEETIIADKTLVAWVAPANLTQKGGSVLTVEKSGGVFDAIVFAELANAKWMAGSNNLRRTQREQDDYPAETVTDGTPVQIAAVYAGQQVSLYRDGQKFADYSVEDQQQFNEDSLVLMGLRHREASPQNRFFTGAIDDARIYSTALSEEQIAALVPNKMSEPPPLAWWDFEQGATGDRMGTFPTTTLRGDSRIADGMLYLDKDGAYLVASELGPDSAMDFNAADATARSLREKLLNDPYRPGYHFVTPEGRCMPFDPNGAIFWKGRYHLFYIFQDARGHNWGHVSSTDLFHWRHHPTGLIEGMFSGNCFINKDGRPTMCYHQVGQGNAMAVALDDDLNEWKKLDSNPITPETQVGDPHHDKYRSWDPYGWIEDDTYYAIFGGKRPAIAKSGSLDDEWTYAGDLLANTVGDVSIDEDISCADFFKIGSRRMLLCISHRLGCRYYLGDWKDEQFHPTFHEQMSWVDNSYFAPESLLDDQGRRIMWAWIFDHPQFGTRMDYGWSGTMSLPRVLTLDEDDRLRMNPPDEIQTLRYNGHSTSSLEVAADSELVLDDISGNSIELSLEIHSDEATQFGITVCRSPDGEEQTRIYYDAAEKKLVVDTRQSSATGGSKTVESGPLTLQPHEPLQLRVFVDKSVVEVFANGRQAVMRRIYPSRKDSVGIAVFSKGGSAKIPQVDAWQMSPSNAY